jgi:hypothetical protein
MIWVGRAICALAMLIVWAEYAKVYRQVYFLHDTVRFLIQGFGLTITVIVVWAVMELASIRLTLAAARRDSERPIRK